jgi:hypothetical protein
MQTNLNVTSNLSTSIGNSKLYVKPKKIFNFFMEAMVIACDSNKLENWFMVENAEYVTINDSNIENFWPETSEFLCNTNYSNTIEITNLLIDQFYLPQNIKQVI